MDERSPYAPPASNPEIYEERKGAAWKAVLLGVVVDIGGTVVISFGAAFVAAMIFTSQGMDEAQFDQLFADRTSPLMVALTIVGGLFSILGGYVCARIAKHNELKLGGVVALFSTLFAIILDDERSGMTEDLLLYTAGIVSILFGSWLGMKRNQRRRLLANQG